MNLRKVDNFPITWLVASTAAATADNYGIIFTAQFPVEVLAVQERHETAGSDAGAVSLQVEKVPSGTAKGAGTNLLSTAFDLKATANVTREGTVIGTPPETRRLSKGDSLALKPSGVMTAVDGVSVTVIVRPL